MCKIDMGEHESTGIREHEIVELNDPLRNCVQKMCLNNSNIKLYFFTWSFDMTYPEEQLL